MNHSQADWQDTSQFTSNRGKTATATGTMKRATNNDKQQQDHQSATSENYHVIFSTSCNQKDWQSYLFFYLAMANKQPGEVTQIVSGCKDQQKEEMIARHKEQISGPMSKNFHIHFTPDYSTPKAFQTTKYWNKPFGVKHWMEHRFGYKYDTEKDDVAELTKFDNDVSCDDDDDDDESL